MGIGVVRATKVAIFAVKDQKEPKVKYEKYGTLSMHEELKVCRNH